MKIKFEDGRVSAEPETEKELRAILKLSHHTRAVQARVIVKHWGRRSYKRSCEICGKKVKGLRGIAQHNRKAHGIKKEINDQI